MIGRIGYFVPKLTVFDVTSRWLMYYFYNEGLVFDVATWADPVNDQKIAKIVLGKTGCIKHAWWRPENITKRPISTILDYKGEPKYTGMQW